MVNVQAPVALLSRLLAAAARLAVVLGTAEDVVFGVP